MSARQSASGKPASFLTKADEFFAFWATSRAENAKSRKIALPALLYSLLPGRSGCSPAEPYPPGKQDHSITSRKELTPSVTFSFEVTVPVR
jgi:hypothetical protein